MSGTLRSNLNILEFALQTQQELEKEHLDRTALKNLIEKIVREASPKEQTDGDDFELVKTVKDWVPDTKLDLSPNTERDFGPPPTIRGNPSSPRNKNEYQMEFEKNTDPLSWDKDDPRITTDPVSGRKEVRIAMEKFKHNKFIEELTKEAERRDPRFLAAMLVRYSEELEDTNPTAGLKLLAIAEGILDAGSI